MDGLNIARDAGASTLFVIVGFHPNTVFGIEGLLVEIVLCVVMGAAGDLLRLYFARGGAAGIDLKEPALLRIIIRYEAHTGTLQLGVKTHKPTHCAVGGIRLVEVGLYLPLTVAQQVLGTVEVVLDENGLQRQLTFCAFLQFVFHVMASEEVLHTGDTLQQQSRQNDDEQSAPFMERMGHISYQT